MQFRLLIYCPGVCWFGSEWKIQSDVISISPRLPGWLPSTGKGGLVRGRRMFVHVFLLLFLEIVEFMYFFDISFPMYKLQTVILGTWGKMTRIKVIGAIY